MERALFKVVGIYCSNCKPIVEKQLKDEKGVKNIDIHYVTDSVTIDYANLLFSRGLQVTWFSQRGYYLKKLPLDVMLG
jgi:Cu+-exporting ATPase